MAEDNAEQSPFTRRGFVAATVVVAVIVVLGLVIVVVNMTRDDPDPAPTSSTSAEPTTAAPTSEPPEAAGGASVCGLDGEELGTARLTSAPAVDEWQYQGTVAYPVSAEFGPGETDPAGFRYCFQHTPEGALFAAANALATGTDQRLVPAWIDYFVAPGPYREQFLNEASNSSTPTMSARLRLAGFRLLSYDGESARIDLAVQASANGSDVTLSMIYNLVWSDGDWKLSAESDSPLDVATIPDVAGYVTFGG